MEESLEGLRRCRTLRTRLKWLYPQVVLQNIQVALAVCFVGATWMFLGFLLVQTSSHGDGVWLINSVSGVYFSIFSMSAFSL